jgi:hypothetical protein
MSGDIWSALDSVGREYLGKQALKQAVSLLRGRPLGMSVSAKFQGLSGGDALKELQDLNGIIGMGGQIPSARSGIDYIPRDNYLVRAHKGEAVITAEENAGRRGGMVQVNLQIDRRTLATCLLDMSRDRIKVVHENGVVYQ